MPLFVTNYCSLCIISIVVMLDIIFIVYEIGQIKRVKCSLRLLPYTAGVNSTCQTTMQNKSQNVSKMSTTLLNFITICDAIKQNESELA